MGAAGMVAVAGGTIDTAAAVLVVRATTIDTGVPTLGAAVLELANASPTISLMYATTEARPWPAVNSIAFLAPTATTSPCSVWVTA
jgi:hypothetical protein